MIQPPAGDVGRAIVPRHALLRKEPGEDLAVISLREPRPEEARLGRWTLTLPTNPPTACAAKIFEVVSVSPADEIGRTRKTHIKTIVVPENILQLRREIA